MTVYSLSVVRLSGVEKVAQSMAIYNLFTGAGALVAAPLAGA